MDSMEVMGWRNVARRFSPPGPCACGAVVKKDALQVDSVSVFSSFGCVPKWSICALWSGGD